MLPNFLRYWKSRSKPNHPMAKKRPSVRLNVEILEDRCTPAVSVTGSIGGTAFFDPNTLGSFSSGDTSIPGAVVGLTGTSAQGTPVNTSATTDANGAFNFANVLPGTYQLNGGALNNFNGGFEIGAPIVVGAGQVINQGLGFQGALNPNVLSLRLFLTESTANSSPFAPAGTGQGIANYRPDTAPVVATPIGDLNVAKSSAATQIDLAGHFTDADITNSQITFHITNGGVSTPLSVTLSDTTAPQTVANFLDYVKSGAYNNVPFSRLVSNFVLQGGGVALNAAGNGLSTIPTNPAVPNEFGASNVADTLALALSGGNVNSGTNQFFFNLVNNSSTLDQQKFTVFGKLTDLNSILNLSSLANTPNKNESASAAATANPTVDLSNVPLNNYTGTNFPTDATAANYMLINSISIDKQTEVLSYSATSSNPGLVTATLNNEHLTLNYAAGQTGTSTITITATDIYGASVQQSFKVTVGP